MATETENKLAVSPAAGEAAADPGTALATREGEPEEPETVQRDTRLDRLRMKLEVMVRLRRFRVADLLALKKGAVLETVQEHSQDVPVYGGGSLLVWAEFEVMEQRLAVRVTRLA